MWLPLGERSALPGLCLYIGTTLLALSPVAHAVPVTPSSREGTGDSSIQAAAPVGTLLSRTGWTVTCDSFETGNECNKAIDGNRNTFWHTKYTGGSPLPPHTITITLPSARNINSVAVLPRQDGNANGRIGRHTVALSTDGTTWSAPVALGTWYSDAQEKFASFEPKSARYIRVTAVTEAAGQAWTSIAEINLYTAASANVATNPSVTGRWGLTVDFPLVPAGGFVEPFTGKVIVYSAYKYDDFGGSNGGTTLTSIWDPATNIVSARSVQNTRHDMFCPGMSMDGSGQMVVTGGSAASKTSIFDSTTDAWLSGPNMKIARGYQSSVTLDDGRVFTIGGSWSGGEFLKAGEVYDPEAKTWTLLPDADSQPLLTADHQGIYRADNHAWLFGWRNGSVFQAGPSKAMHWYATGGTGGVSAAGNRLNDPDSMCGNAVMYDAVAGKILTFGGAPSYQDRDATAKSHIITIGDPDTPATVVTAGGGAMKYRRTFHTSVVLPDGTVFVAGGQTYGVPFSDANSIFTAELYTPSTDTWSDQHRNSVPRTYHSISLLLPDATVLTGGGGLCGGCRTNHFDAQIFTPKYLFSGTSLATRPSIVSVSSDTVSIGGSFSFTTNSGVSSASLIRYGSSTHGVNTDQRRVPLSITAEEGSNTYSTSIPDDAGVVTPGYWMLFALNSDGVPSVAQRIYVPVP